VTFYSFARGIGKRCQTLALKLSLVGYIMRIRCVKVSANQQGAEIKRDETQNFPHSSSLPGSQMHIQSSHVQSQVGLLWSVNINLRCRVFL
jgi:hypothetical protein